MLPPHNRLPRSAFLQLKTTGLTFPGQYFTLIAARSRQSTSPPRVGFIVSAKTVPRANRRHHLKRRLRHAVRPHLSLLPSGILVIVLAAPSAPAASFTALSAEINRRFRDL